MTSSPDLGGISIAIVLICVLMLSPNFFDIAKKYYTELMFDNNDEKFFHWLENLESKCYQLIYEKKGVKTIFGGIAIILY